MAKYIVINGSTRKGNSYAIANFIKEKIDGDVEKSDFVKLIMLVRQKTNA